MTEVGWTREKPTVAGWYWWRVEVSDLNITNVRYCEKAVAIWETAAGLFVGGQGYLQDLGDGEWLGPITPDSYQHGRVAGLREAAGAICMYCNDPRNWAPMSNSGYHVCNTPGPNHVRCQATLIHELLAQQAQDEKGVGE